MVGDLLGITRTELLAALEDGLEAFWVGIVALALITIVILVTHLVPRKEY